MSILLIIIHLIGAILIGGFIYIRSGEFKILSEASMTGLNKSLSKKKVKVNKDDARSLASSGFTLFIIIGFFTWSYIGVTVGRITFMMTDHFILKWINYIVMFLLFLIIPKMKMEERIEKRYPIKKFLEKKLFFWVMLVFYLLAIFCYEDIPLTFNWYLGYLE